MHPIHIWFVCKQCRSSFQKVDQFIEHKQQHHLGELRKFKCIVFEERTSDYDFIDGLPNLYINPFLNQPAGLNVQQNQPRSTQLPSTDDDGVTKCKFEKSVKQDSSDAAFSDDLGAGDDNCDDFEPDFDFSILNTETIKSVHNPYVRLKRLSPREIRVATSSATATNGSQFDVGVVSLTSDEENSASDSETDDDGTGTSNFPSNPKKRKLSLKSESKHISDSRYSSIGQFIFPTEDADAENDETLVISDWVNQQLQKSNENITPNIIQLDPDPISTYITSVTTENPLICKLCCASLTSNTELKIHVKHCWLFNKRKHRYCTICDKAVYAPKYLRRHILKCHGAAVFESSGYSYNYRKPKPPPKIRKKYKPRRKPMFQKKPVALELETAGSFRCTVCNKTFKMQSHLNLHSQTKHANFKPFKCPSNNCPLTFDGSEDLKSHIAETHNENLDNDNLNLDPNFADGELCNNLILPSVDDHLTLRDWLVKQKDGKVSGKNIVLLDPDPSVENVGAITSDSPIECGLCCVKLNSESEVRTHVTHCWMYNKSRHRYCVPCQKLYVSPFKFRRHYLNHHVTEEDKATLPRFLCQFCPKEFFEKKFLAKHEESHKSLEEQVRPFVCEFCGKAFRSRSDLTKHVDIHSEDRAYKCTFPDCPASFKQRRGLRCHLQRSHKS